MSRAIVVGAGIAGLAAAFRLDQAGFEVQVLEAGARVGGRMSTVRRAGYAIDPGASFISSACAPMTALARDAGVGAELQPTSSVFGIVRRGQIHRIGMDAPLRALGTGLLSTRAKASLAGIAFDIARVRRRIDYADLTLAGPFDDESLETYARRRTNREAYDYLVEPMSAACFGVAPSDATKASFFFMLANFLLAGGCVNSANGIAFLAEGIARRLGTVQLQARVDRVAETVSGVEVTWRDAAGRARTDTAAVAVIAVPGPLMLEMYPQLSGEARSIVGGVEYSRSISVALGLTRVPRESAAVLIVPHVEHPDVLVVVLEHNKAPGRAPAGHGLVTFDWQGPWSQAHWDATDDELAALTRAAIARALPGLIDPAAIEMTHVTRWEHCLMRGRPGHFRALGRLREITEPRGRVQLAGDYLGLSATGAALCSGETAARRLISHHAIAP